MSCVRYLAGTEPSSVISATADLLPADTRIDTGTTAVLAFPNDVTAEIMCHSLMPGWGPLGLLPRFPDVNVEARCEGGVVSLSNFVVPHIWHSINVTMSGGQKRVEKVYTYKDGKEKGEAWWSTCVLVFIFRVRSNADDIRVRMVGTDGSWRPSLIRLRAVNRRRG